MVPHPLEWFHTPQTLEIGSIAPAEGSGPPWGIGLRVKVFKGCKAEKLPTLKTRARHEEDGSRV